MPELPFDAEYIRRLQCGDAEAQSHLVNHFRRRTWLQAHRMLHEPEDAEDAAQETLMRVLRYFQSGGSLDNPAALPGFVWSTCRNICLEFNQKERTRGKSPELDPVDPSPSPEWHIINEEQKRRLMEVLDQLPGRDRNLLLAALAGEDRDDMCGRFGVKPNYLRVLLHRAIAAARRLADGDASFFKKAPGGMKRFDSGTHIDKGE